jgi:uncharacterized protein YjdB
MYETNEDMILNESEINEEQTMNETNEELTLNESALNEVQAMNVTIENLTSNESEQNDNCENKEACCKEHSRKFDVLVPIKIKPFGKPDKDDISVECNGNLTTAPGNACQGNQHMDFEYTIVQEIKVMIPVKFGAEVCVDESCFQDKGFQDLGLCSEDPPVIHADSIKLNYTDIKLEKNKTRQLTATVLPDNCHDKSVTWKSSNATYATVSTNGLITAVREGNARITAETVNGKMAYCDVKVEDD